ncbi:probable protein phosphatase 2C 8 isoform X2 [Phaseolus vulgaris]|uniref:probable protein phosphatase 2C 8 isoform X2 n=1 Tax=Phaseolus vulgaris TaxID=3885 RepID=UPI0035CB0878
MHCYKDKSIVESIGCEMDSTDSRSTKSKETERRFDNYPTKRKRPCQVTVVSTTEESKAAPSPSSATHGSISVIGRRRAMEDAVMVVPGLVAAGQWCGGYDFFAVYDGHGGTLVANACRDRLHLLLADEVRKNAEKGLDWYEVMCSCFMKMDKEIGVGGDGHKSRDDGGGNTMGSTAAVVVVGEEEIVVANCGDSRAVLCRGGLAVPLSLDHKPDRPDERERIEAAGGIVINWNGSRVLGVLATSRSIEVLCVKRFGKDVVGCSVELRSWWLEVILYIGFFVFL